MKNNLDKKAEGKSGLRFLVGISSQTYNNIQPPLLLRSNLKVRENRQLKIDLVIDQLGFRYHENVN